MCVFVVFVQVPPTLPPTPAVRTRVRLAIFAAAISSSTNMNTVSSWNKCSINWFIFVAFSICNAETNNTFAFHQRAPQIGSINCVYVCAPIECENCVPTIGANSFVHRLTRSAARVWKFYQSHYRAAYFAINCLQHNRSHFAPQSCF